MHVCYDPYYEALKKNGVRHLDIKKGIKARILFGLYNRLTGRSNQLKRGIPNEWIQNNDC